MEPRRRAQQQGCGGQSGEILAQRIGADQHSPAGEASLLTCRHPKTHHQTQSCPPERQDPASSTRTQAPVPSTRKPTQPTEPTLATGGRHQELRELRTCSLRKGDPKHSKLSKMRRQRNTQQMKEKGKKSLDQTNEKGTDSLPEKEFRVMIVKISKILEIE